MSEPTATPGGPDVAGKTATTPVPCVSDRDRATGRFALGNTVSRRHGLYASSLAEALAAEREAFLAQSLQDDGGAAEVPTRHRSLHIYRSRLHLHIEQLSGALEGFGLFDKRGRLRTAWLQRLEGLIARAQAIDGTLGLQRRTKPVLSARDIIAEYGDRGEEGSR